MSSSRPPAWLVALNSTCIYHYIYSVSSEDVRTTSIGSLLLFYIITNMSCCIRCWSYPSSSLPTMQRTTTSSALLPPALPPCLLIRTTVSRPNNMAGFTTVFLSLFNLRLSFTCPAYLHMPLHLLFHFLLLWTVNPRYLWTGTMTQLSHLKGNEYKSIRWVIVLKAAGALQ